MVSSLSVDINSSIISGVAEAGSTVSIHIDGNPTPSATVLAGEDGSFTVDSISLNESNFYVTALALNTLEMVSGGLSLNVNLSDSSELLGTTSVDNNGDFSLDSSLLSYGDHNLYTTSTDSANNTSYLSTPLSISIANDLDNNINSLFDLDASRSFYSSSGIVGISSDGRTASITEIHHDIPSTNSLEPHVSVYKFFDSWTQLGNDITDGISTVDDYKSVLSADGSKLVLFNHGYDSNNQKKSYISTYKWENFADAWVPLGETLELEASSSINLWRWRNLAIGNHEDLSIYKFSNNTWQQTGDPF